MSLITSTLPAEQHGAIRLVRLHGSSYERGWQHGTTLKAEVRYFCDAFYRDLLYARNRVLGASLSTIFLALATQMERFIPEPLREEMRGIADGAGVPYRDILILNSFDDAIHALAKLAPIAQTFDRCRGFLGCSSFVHMDSSSLMHGRNLDYMVADSAVDPDGVVTRVLREHVTVFVHEPDQGLSFTSVSWPGYVGVVTGMNQAGLSLACHTSWTPGETTRGIPLPLLYRCVMQRCGSLGQAEAMLRRAPRTIGNNLSLASGRETRAMALELTPGHVAAWAPRHGQLAVTNHFQDPALIEPQARAGWVVQNSLSRLERLHTLLPAAQPGWASAEAILRDTEPPRPELSEWDRLVNPGTIYSTIFDPVHLALRLRVYDRPDRAFHTIDLPWEPELSIAA